MQRHSILLASTSLHYSSQCRQKLPPVILFIIHYKKVSVLMVNLSSMGSTLSVHLLCCPFPLFSWQRKLTKSTLAIVASCLLCRPQCSSQVFLLACHGYTCLETPTTITSVLNCCQLHDNYLQNNTNYGRKKPMEIKGLVVKWQRALVMPFHKAIAHPLQLVATVFTKKKNNITCKSCMQMLSGLKKFTLGQKQ